jgi:hypothetical protein
MDDWQVCNDTPVWFKPRRTVYFIMRNGEIINKSNGHRRFFKTREAAERAMERMQR